MITSKSTEGFSSPFSASNPPPHVPDHELVRRIGCGSYGEVWLARSTVGAWRAVKVVYQSTFENARPFEREFSGIQRFEPISRSNEGFVDILQVGRNEQEKYFYYVMELADDTAAVLTSGADLFSEHERSGAAPVRTAHVLTNVATYVPHTLAAERLRKTRLPAGQCLQLGISLSLALDHLHGSGLIHRDIKPSNIVFVNGVPKLADIGLVAELGESQSYVGTEGFIPPEGPNSAQADIYGLGKVLYEITTGKDRHDFPEPPSELAAAPDRRLLVELNAIVLRACDPDPRHRYKSAREMHDELLLLQAGKSVRQKRAGERRFKGVAMVGAAAALCTMLVVAVDRTLDWRVKSIQLQQSALRPRLMGKIDPRDLKAPKETIDLTPHYTASLTERWYPGPAENTLSALPRGLQTLAGVKFDVRGLVQLSGAEISNYGADSYPTTERIPVGRWVKRLHFLQGSLSEMAEGGKVGSYRIHYRSGRSVELPIAYGRDVRALWQPAKSSGVVSNALVAWSGDNAPTRERNMALRVYKLTWDNPALDDEVLGIQFVSAMKNSAPFLMALTTEEHEPPVEQRMLAVDLIKTLQSKVDSFQRLASVTNAESVRFAQLKLNARPVPIAGKSYDGIRFTVPNEGPTDLVWAFRGLRNLHLQGWYILPVQGGMKVGFEDWYHYEGTARAGSKDSPELVVQYLTGKKLERGRDYFIWFSFDDAKPIDFEAALRFVRAGEVDANKPESLAKALGLSGADSATPAKFHRHYCLGSIR